MRGKFITFEGIDGAGKSTHIESVRAFLAARGKTVVMTREPGGTELGEAIRGLFLDRSMSPASEALLVFAARREHLERVVWPALERGDWVLCDRFTDATFAYQGGGREMGFDRIQVLADWVHPGFAPDLTLLFDLPPDAAHDRVAHRARCGGQRPQQSRCKLARFREVGPRRRSAADQRCEVTVTDGREGSCMEALSVCLEAGNEKGADCSAPFRDSC